MPEVWTPEVVCESSHVAPVRASALPSAAAHVVVDATILIQRRSAAVARRPVVSKLTVVSTAAWIPVSKEEVPVTTACDCALATSASSTVSAKSGRGAIAVVRPLLSVERGLGGGSEIGERSDDAREMGWCG